MQPLVSIDFADGDVPREAEFSRSMPGYRFGPKGNYRRLAPGEVPLDYDPETMEERGVRLEPNRTNLRSSGTPNGGQVTVGTVSDLESPLSEETVYRVAYNSNNGIIEGGQGGTSLSVWAKDDPSNTTDVGLWIGSFFHPSGGKSDDFVGFNLRNGTIIGTSKRVADYEMIPGPNGWYWCWASFPYGSGNFGRIRSGNRLHGDPPVGEGFFMAGLQAEIGTAATSFIPPGEARPADQLTIPGLPARSEATVFIDYELPYPVQSPSDVLTIGEGEPQLRVSAGPDGLVGGRAEITPGEYVPFWGLPQGRNRLVYGLKENDHAQFVSGSHVHSDTLRGFGQVGGDLTITAPDAPIWIRSVRVYPERLSNEEMRQLSRTGNLQVDRATSVAVPGDLSIEDGPIVDKELQRGLDTDLTVRKGTGAVQLDWSGTGYDLYKVSSYDDAYLQRVGPQGTYAVLERSDRESLELIAEDAAPPITREDSADAVYVLADRDGNMTRKRRDPQPTNRWSFTGAPNLYANGAEDFTADNSTWKHNGCVLDGVVDNVGPNGESAYKFTFPGGTGKLEWQGGALETGERTTGFFLRTVSGTAQMDIRHANQTVFTATEEWQWHTRTSADGFGQGKLRGQDNSDFSIYLFRACLNRGTELRWSTDPSEPVIFEDVVGGEDIPNGTEGSPEVHAAAPSGIVAPGNSTWTQETESATYAVRFRVPKAVNGINFPFGTRNGHFVSLNYSGTQGWERWFGQTKYDYNYIGNVGLQGDYVAVIGVDYDRNKVIYIDPAGRQVEFDNPSPMPTEGKFHPLGTSGPDVVTTHLEKYPFLDMEDSQAVWDRLSSEPKTTLEPAEVWDFSRPHNYWQHPFDYTQGYWIKQGGSIATTGLSGPKPEWPASEFVEDTTDVVHGIEKSHSRPIKGSQGTVAAVVKPNGRDRVILNQNADGADWTSVEFDLASGTVVREEHGSGTDVGGGKLSVDSSSMRYLSDGFYLIRHQFSIAGDPMFFGRKGGVFPVPDTYTFNNRGRPIYTGDGASGITVAGISLFNGHDPSAEPTDAGVPQHVPALKSPGHDLQLGSTSGSDDNDPYWVAPIGITGEHVSSQPLPFPQFVKNQHRTNWTFVYAMRSNGGGFQFNYPSGNARFAHAGNEYLINISDTAGNKVGINPTHQAVGIAPNDGTLHAVSLHYNSGTGKVRGFIDDTKIGEFHIYEEGIQQELTLNYRAGFLSAGKPDTLGQLLYFDRNLSDEEAAHVRQKLLDSPTTPNPLA